MASADWVRIVGEGRWADFRGLPPSLAERELIGALGRTHVTSHWRASRLSGIPVTLVEMAGMRYWLDDDRRVLMAELHDPPSARSADDLLAVLGPPERQSGGRYRRYGVMTTEYAYPRRGLAVTVGESYDDPPTFPRFVAAVHVFAATDVDGFIGRLGGEDHLGPSGLG
jgi:hypothetical protein